MFGCQKCQSNLARAWFSHSTLPIPEDFAMDEDRKPTTLRDLEIDFLKEQLNGFLLKAIIVLDISWETEQR